MLYREGEEIEEVRFRLGSENDHEVFKAEIVRLILALHLARNQRDINKLSIWIDNTSAITATDTATPRPYHYLLNHFHTILTELRQQHPMLKVVILWILGHEGVDRNERADEEAKIAAAGRSGPRTRLPLQLHKPLPRSRTSIVQTYRAKLEEQHNKTWRTSPRYAKFSLIDASEATKASRSYWKLSRNLPRKLLSILTQLRTGHAPLCLHLHRICQADSPECPCCKRHPKTVIHYLMEPN